MSKPNNEDENPEQVSSKLNNDNLVYKLKPAEKGKGG